MECAECAVANTVAYAQAVEDALSAGDVAALQIRMKEAPEREIEDVVRALMPICHRHDVAVILNDNPRLAKKLGCDGVHVGAEDTPLDEARRIMGPNAMIGVTCADSRHRAMEAAEGGADYVAFGAFYPTETHTTLYRTEPEILTIWSQTMQTPCVAIGGIKVDNCAALVKAGADFICVVTGIWDYPQGPGAAVRDFNAAIAAA